MINDLIAQALQEFELPIYYIDRGEKIHECIVFNHLRKPKSYADNQRKSYEYTINLNVYISVIKDALSIRNDMTTSLIKAGFKEKPVNLINKEGEYFNIPLQFKKII